ncbi:MAG: ATP-binding cassette domain-containing protein [Sphingomonas sp.]|uniref:ATP-binding cassette domain-containing protein n=1 Tax=Sphingomonas sp. TaxID=28214 RepID=UPI0025D4941A|nr:ATP-binding cassette domain-containing protein [Sphingomonas sp.]MBY0282472.1 ATP-binding cassette domain-containing protein [Sphingomonas sp.]
MSFDVDIARRVGEAEVAVRIASEPGLTILFGPSGVGKTSVLNMIAGLLPPARGRIAVGGGVLFDADAGVDVPVAQRRAGYVFQEPRLFPHMRVRANLDYGAGRGESRLGLDETVSFLGIAPLLDRWPRSLSGGEARRVAIGRALLSRPSFLLLDEPLASLDRARREEIMRAIEHIRDGLKLPILMVTHDAEEAERLATQIIRMER